MARDARTPTLIVFGGLPGTGKTTLARALARDLGATYLRIDEIEQAIRDSGLNSEEVGVSGYRVGYALAESNLRLGAAVVADSVNPLRITRLSWRSVAERPLLGSWRLKSSARTSSSTDAEWTHAMETFQVCCYLRGNRSRSVPTRSGTVIVSSSIQPTAPLKSLRPS